MRFNLYGAGLRPRLHLAVAYYTLGRLKSREAAAAMRHMEFRSAEIAASCGTGSRNSESRENSEGRQDQRSRKTLTTYIASLPAEMLAFIEVEMPNPRALSKIRNYLQKWRPLRMASPAGELEALGVERGPKFDKIVEQFFELQLRGKGKTPEDRTKILKNLAGIKDEIKKPEKEKKKRKGAPEAAAHAESKPQDKSKGAGAGGKAAPAANNRGKIRARWQVSSRRRRSPDNRQQPRSVPRPKLSTIKPRTTTKPPERNRNRTQQKNHAASAQTGAITDSRDKKPAADSCYAQLQAGLE